MIADDATIPTGRLRDVLKRRARARPPLELLASRAAALTAAGLTSTGLVAMCCRPVSGPEFAASRERLAYATTPHARLVHWEWDVHGQQWVLLTGESLRKLATAARNVERTLERDGFGGLLLLTVFGMHDGKSCPVHLVYDHRTRLFSPFAPCRGHERDAGVEQAAIAALDTLPVQPDEAHWVPVWDSPLMPG